MVKRMRRKGRRMVEIVARWKIEMMWLEMKEL